MAGGVHGDDAAAGEDSGGADHGSHGEAGVGIGGNVGVEPALDDDKEVDNASAVVKGMDDDDTDRMDVHLLLPGMLPFLLALFLTVVDRTSACNQNSPLLSSLSLTRLATNSFLRQVVVAAEIV